jgi:hypothetical protein
VRIITSIAGKYNINNDLIAFPKEGIVGGYYRWIKECFMGGRMGANAMNNGINLKMYPVLSCVPWLKI